MLISCPGSRAAFLGPMLNSVLSTPAQGTRDHLMAVLPRTKVCVCVCVCVCGFRRGRSCTDMIFVVRQMVEKAFEHRGKAFLLFIDLRKAYDSVSRDCLWRVLEKAGVPPRLLSIVQSFHTSMQATICVDGDRLDPFAVRNGLRQGCSMAPTLFNIFMWAVFQRWYARVADIPGAGVPIHTNARQRLFFRRHRTDTRRSILDCQFADDSALMATRREAIETCLTAFVEVAGAFGLKVNLEKTKLMVTGHHVTEEDVRPLMLNGHAVEVVSEFRYLGTNIHADGRCSRDIESRIAAASRAFGVLSRPVFRDNNLTLATKRTVFEACVLSLLLYASECWVPLQADIAKLSSFYMRCLRTIMGVSRSDVWDFHISNTTILEQWNDARPLPIKDRIVQRRLEWFGHVMRMDMERTPRVVLFGCRPETRPACGPRKRWRDALSPDLQRCDVQDSWPEDTQSRPGWRNIYRELEPASSPVRNVQCLVCRRVFSRPSDKRRHKCLDERAKPIAEQRGAVQCPQCQRWLRSRGGLSRHKCTPHDPQPRGDHPQAIARDCCAAHCPTCDRCFARPSDRSRHKCHRNTHRPTAATRLTFEWSCPDCGRRFRRGSDLTRHRCQRPPSSPVLS